MKVPAYNEQMRYATSDKGGRINGVQYSGQVAFENNARMGKALSGLGNTLARVSDEVYATNMKINEADATKALTQYQKEFLAKQTEIQQLKGEQALHASEDFETWQQQRKQELTKDLSPVAMGMFEQKAGVTFESNRQWVTNYQQGQQKVYEDSVYQANIDTLKDTYLQNINDPKVMQECIDQMFDAKHQYYEKNGLSQEAAKIDYKNEREKWATAGIGLHIDNGQLGKARALLQHNSVYLSPDTQAQLKKKISNEQERLNVKAQVQQFNNQVNGLVGNAKNIIQSDMQYLSKEQLQVNIDKMIDENAASYEAAEKARTMIKSIINREYEKRDTEKAAFAQNLFGSGYSPEMQNTMVQQAQEDGEISKEEANCFIKMIATQDAPTTDWIGYSQIKTNLVNDVYKTHDEFIQDVEKVPMTFKDREEILKAYNDRNDPILKQNNSYQETALKALNANLKNPKNQSQSISFARQKEKNDALFASLVRDFERANGRSPNQTECFDIANQITNQEVIVKNYQGRSNVNYLEELSDIASDYEEKTSRSFDYNSQLETAENLLLANDIPVTDENKLRILRADDVNAELDNIRYGRPSEKEKEKQKYTMYDEELENANYWK